MALLYRIYWTTESSEYSCLFCEYYETANPDFARQKIKLKEHMNKTLCQFYRLLSKGNILFSVH